MSATVRHAHYSLEEYLRLEEYSNVKHEYLDGQIYAMAGGTPEHGALAVRLTARLLEQLRGRRCSVYSSDVRVRVAVTGLDTYPDASVVCGHEQRDAQDRNALTNPIVLAEVLSPSTEEYDRGEKLTHYKHIASLQEVVLVSHGERRVEVCRREGQSWRVLTWGAGETARLESIGCTIEIDELYRDPFAPPAA
jgi:Uma2 family endonuclease